MASMATGRNREDGNITSSINKQIKLPIKLNTPHAASPVQISQGVWDITLSSKIDNEDQSTGTIMWFSADIDIKIPDGYVLQFSADKDLLGSGYMIYGGTYTMPPIKDERSEIVLPLVRIKSVDDLDLPHAGIIMTMIKTVDALMILDMPPKIIGLKQSFSRVELSREPPVSSRNTSKVPSSKKHSSSSSSKSKKRMPMA